MNSEELLINQCIERLECLQLQLRNTTHFQEKLDIVKQEECVQTYLLNFPTIKEFVSGLAPALEFVFYSLIIIGQAPLALDFGTLENGDFSDLFSLLSQLIGVDSFYDHMGGLIGYHVAMLKLILMHRQKISLKLNSVRYSKPEGFDLHQETAEVNKIVRFGIESIPEVAEMYPVGGAGDRMDLHNEETGEPLPAALLRFEGRTLLEGLIRDLQAREYLYYKFFGKQVTTPIAMMTSNEKQNHYHILDVCLAHKMFGRPPDSYSFFIQPVVPVVTIEGCWSRSGPFNFTLKPGGHGVIWKLARDCGVLDKFEKEGRLKAIIRQINNPIAGTDHTILALLGIGCKDNKAFGFASCDRILNSAEGVNVLIEKEKGNGYAYCISNIEYTDMAVNGIEEKPIGPGSPFSEFPANTNTLFVDLNAVREALKINPIPGQLVNMKHKFPLIDGKGNLKYIEGGRLESLMQNIADYLEDEFPEPASTRDLEHLRTFITYNQRKKTISTTKKLYHERESPISTPEAAFYDRLQNYRELFRNKCRISVPDLPGIDEYLVEGPSFIVFMHPAVGSLYSIISQKLRGGCLKKGAELQLEIAEVDIENLNLDGSLLIDADQVMGVCDDCGILQYGETVGRCILKNVIVKNRGINFLKHNLFWKNEIYRNEALKIHLAGNAEFYAEGVTFIGNHYFEVPDGYRLIVYQNGRDISFRQEKIHEPTWHWTYSFDSTDMPKLYRNTLKT